jgi:TolB-like protein
VIYVFEDYSLDTDRRELRRGRQVIAAEPQIFDLLQYLISNRERVVSKDDLLAAVWDGRIVSESTLSSSLSAVRHAVCDSGEEQRLIKTVPRKGVRFVGVVREERQPSAVAEADAKPKKPGASLTLPDLPSIAVLPLDNLSGDKGQDYFCDGITEDIITELSRFSELFVIARNSSFQFKGKAADVRQVGRELGVRYVLQGSIRRAGDRVRISVQLADAVTGAHRWAERYDRQLEDVFAVQDEVARTIVAILAAHVNKAEIERSLNKPPETWQAYDYYLRAAGIQGLLSVIMGGGRTLRDTASPGADPCDRPQLRARLRQACPHLYCSLAPLAGRRLSEPSCPRPGMSAGPQGRATRPQPARSACRARASPRSQARA